VSGMDVYKYKYFFTMHPNIRFCRKKEESVDLEAFTIHTTHAFFSKAQMDVIIDRAREKTTSFNKSINNRN
jgi:hypothetical protein